MKKIDWKKLPFGYMKTACNVRIHYQNGKWGKIRTTSSEFIDLHIASTSLHYGQEAFEGMKAYMGKDGKIRVFRWKDNASRLIDSARGILMPEVPEDLFFEAISTAVKKNKKFIPPYGTGATLYIRPLLIGSDPGLGVKPAKEYVFLVFVTPVGPYFKQGFKPVDMMICRGHDRAAPLGTGNIKVGGNYAASLISLKEAYEKGYSTVIYLDAVQKKYIDECGPANFFGIKENTYITPDSKTILPSITNKSLIRLAKEAGMNIEVRPVHIDELDTFEEAGACGTAAVISPIGRIVDPEQNREYLYSKDGKPGKICKKLYNKLTGIQFGDEPDPYNWITVIE